MNAILENYKILMHYMPLILCIIYIIYKIKGILYIKSLLYMLLIILYYIILYYIILYYIILYCLHYIIICRVYWITSDSQTLLQGFSATG